MVKLPFLNRTQESLNKFLTININSDYAQVLAFYREGNKCKIIGNGEQKLEYGSVRSGVIIDVEDVSEAVGIAAEQATKDLLEEEIKQAIIGVTGDLCIGINTTSRYKRGKNDVIKGRDLNELYSKIVEAAYMQAQNNYLDTTGDADADLEIVTTSSVYAKVDGRYVPEIEGQEGNVIETSVFNAFAPIFHIKMLQKVAKNSGLNLLAIGSELYAIAQQIKDTQIEDTDYVIVDIARDRTNIAIVFSGGIVGTKSYNIGYSHLVEGVSEKMGLTKDAGEKVLEAHINEQLTAGESSIVHTCIIETVDIWLTGLEISFNEFKGVKTFPSKIFLLGQGTMIPTVLEMTKNEPWTKSIAFKEPPVFKKVEFTDLEKVVDSTGVSNTEKWITQSCLSIIYSEMFTEEEVKDDQN